MNAGVLSRRQHGAGSRQSLINTANLMPDDRRSLTVRLSSLQYIVAVTFAALAVGFWIFQVAQHEKFKEMAENNHLRRLPLPAPRGVLFDRDGKVLVENQNTFNIALVREQTKNLDETLRTLAVATGVDEAQLRETVDRRRREPSYRPIVLDRERHASNRSSRSGRASGSCPASSTRKCRPGSIRPSDLAAHLFGYVGEINEAQLQRAEYEGVEPGTIVGQAGIEQAYNKLLMGTDGNKTVVVNSVGREIRRARAGQQPNEGHRLQLTIDADVQKADRGWLRGVAASTAPRSCSIRATARCSASPAGRPTIPNAFAAGIDRATWARSTPTSSSRCRTARCRAATRPGRRSRWRSASPASRKASSRPTSGCYCGGGANFYGRYFKCWKKGGHGTVDLRHAIEQSCDVYFYTVGNMLGVDRINKWATLFGLGVKSNIDLPNECTGLVPSTRVEGDQREKKWYAGETISVAIGQGQVR